jgi:hypothetical protein
MSSSPTIAPCSIVSSRALALGLVLLAAGCENQTRPPPPPDPDGAIIRPPPPRPRDSGVSGFDATLPDADPDVDAGAVAGCVAAGPLNDATVTQDAMDYPFEPTLSFVTWASGARCDPPTLVAGLSERTCGPGIAPELLFLINADAVGGMLTTGTIDLELAVLDGSLTVVFRDGIATWESCTGASGTLDIESIGVDPGDRVRMDFDLTLVHCAMTELPIDVAGAVSIVVADAYEDVCPP